MNVIQEHKNQVEHFAIRDDGILFIKGKGSLTSQEMAREKAEITHRLAALYPGQVNLLIDLSEAGLPALGAQRVLSNAVTGEKFGKIAFFGPKGWLLKLASTALKLVRKKEIKIFKEESEALQWLKG